MQKTVTRRAFVAGGAVAVATAAAPAKIFAQGPTVIRRSPAKRFLESDLAHDD